MIKFFANVVFFSVVGACLLQTGCQSENEADKYPQPFCDTTAVKYSADVAPILAANCVGCHSASVSSGGIDLSSYSAIIASGGPLLVVGEKTRLEGSIKALSGFKAMPPSGNPLSSCQVNIISQWIAIGAPNN